MYGWANEARCTLCFKTTRKVPDATVLAKLESNSRDRSLSRRNALRKFTFRPKLGHWSNSFGLHGEVYPQVKLYKWVSTYF